MAKVRVYELARDLGIESKLLVNTLKSIGISVASHQSSIESTDVDKVRQAMQGGVAKKSPSEAAIAGAKKGSVKVIRRRRVTEETPTVPPAEAEAASTEVAPPAEEPAAASAEPAAAKTASDAVSDSPAPDEASAISAAEATPVEEEAPAAPKRRASVGGATVVRRATPEEVEANKVQREQITRRKSKKEDSKGTKYTGIGTSEDTVARGATPDMPSEKPTTRRAAVGGKDRRKDTEEEEAAAKKSATAKAKREGAINTRTLLSEAEKLVAEVSGPDEAEVEVQTPAARTVYTPSAAHRRRDLKRRKDLKKTNITVARASYRVVTMGDTIQVGEFAKQLKVKSGEVIKKLMDQGLMVTVNQTIDLDTATLVATEYNYEIKSTVRSFGQVIGLTEEQRAQLPQQSRPPIVTVMGHVDHGKTSILDAIRKTDVVAGEAGGITQHIGAYQVSHNGKKMAFLDTPGHEAFGSMRARGATVTDIVILVVAADDGVMPQTIEAIAHAKDAGVPMIVAVNKIDKPNINVERIYTELTEHGVQAEEWGGETQFVKVSALERTGIDELLESILLQTEILELKSPSDCPGEGTVVEAHLDTGRGPVATVVVQDGTLKTGDFIVAGTVFGRARAMHDHTGKQVEKAGPSTPVAILGLSGVPLAGDKVNVVDSEKRARDAVDWRVEQAAEVDGRSSAQSLEDLLGKMKDSETPEMPIIIKGDTQGSVEAIVEALAKLNTEDVMNKIVHKAVGGISESDITLAETSGAVIVGFNVRAARGLDDAADQSGVVLKYFSVIYDLIDAVKNLMAGKLPPIVEEVTQGRAEVRQSISVPKIGTIAGSAVTDGKINRSSHLRLIRDDIVVYTGKIGSLRRFKEDVREVKSGYECGIGIENYNDIKIGDVIEAFEIVETRPTL